RARLGDAPEHGGGERSVGERVAMKGPIPAVLGRGAGLFERLQRVGEAERDALGLGKAAPEVGALRDEARLLRELRGLREQRARLEPIAVVRGGLREKALQLHE